MTTDIILIGGKSESGKGTVAEEVEKILQTNEEYNVIRCSLSTWIRETMKKDFYWDGVDTPESRKAMAEMYRVGTEFYPYHMARRVWERDILPKLLRVKVARKPCGYSFGMPVSERTEVHVKCNIAIVESFREKNNYDYFVQLQNEGKINNIFTVNVIRPNYESTQKIKNHVSEVDLDAFEFDYKIVNYGTVDDLKRNVKAFSNYLTDLHYRCTI